LEEMSEEDGIAGARDDGREETMKLVEDEGGSEKESLEAQLVGSSPCLILLLFCPG
jgi:hypothetical protein